jgi:uncharacterized membrane protein YeaQ/YmgE (transglycosylase-associated protein family)
METLHLVFVLGVVGAAVAVGLAHVLAAVTGGVVTPDEMVRHAILTFVIAATVVVLLRRRTSS